MSDEDVDSRYEELKAFCLPEYQIDERRFKKAFLDAGKPSR